MEIDLPKTIKFLEAFRDLHPEHANSLYRWQVLLQVLPEVRIESYLESPTVEHAVTSIHFVIDGKWTYRINMM